LVVTALKDLSLDIAAGEFVVIVGPNASGKSTLLELIAGCEHPDSGAIMAKVAGQEQDWTRDPMASRSRYIARIHQDPTVGTADDLTVIEHLRLAGLSRAPIPFVNSVPAGVRRAIGARLSTTVIAARSDALVSELSYGQRQLLALEMAATRSAKILLLDEPTASLDRANTAFCMRRVQEFHQKQRPTILLVTHDMAVAAHFGDRLIVFRDGRLRADLAGAQKAALRPADVFHLCGFDALIPAEAPSSLRTSETAIETGA
jgi:putative ABC transport system ATP-binding protein